MSSGPARLLLNKITVNINGSPPFFDRMPLVHTLYDASYLKCYSSDDTKNKIRTADKRLTYPGRTPPGPHSEHRPQPGSRVSRQVSVYPWGKRTATSVTTLPIGRAHRIAIQGER